MSDTVRQVTLRYTSVKKILAATTLLAGLMVLAALQPTELVSSISERVTTLLGNDITVIHAATSNDRSSLLTSPATAYGGGREINSQQGMGSEVSNVQDSVFQKISNAAALYDQSAVRAIAPYLLNPNRDVRRLALDALVRVGDATGAGELQEAAQKIMDPREASAFLDAADFLSLPSISQGVLANRAESVPEK